MNGNSERDLLSRFGIVKASTKQVENNVLQRMQHKLQEDKLAALKSNITKIQKELDYFGRRREVYIIEKQSDIGDDPDLLFHWKQYKKLQQLQLEYSQLAEAAKKQNKAVPSPSVLTKRPVPGQLPGNLPKRQRVESEQERKIRLGQITPFARVGNKNNTLRPFTASRNPTRNSQTKKPEIKVSSCFKRSAPTDIGVAIVRRKKQQRGTETEKPAKRRRAKDASIAESVPDFVVEKKNVVLEGGYQLPKKVYNKLFQHQKTSVKWLWELYRSEVGGIIADEMGLGKTIQVVCFMAGLHYSGMLQLPSLIVCPTTIMTQWQLEFKKWWPHLRVEILHSSECNDFEYLLKTVKREKGVIVTSYGTLQSFEDIILPLEYELVVLDEGHKIRNPDAMVTISCKQLRSPNRIILTGAPIQNNLQELWSLFDFIFPGKLGTLPIFKENFEKPIRMGGYSNASKKNVQAAYKCAVVLRDEIKPFLLRRMKDDVEIGLPEKFEQVLFCPLLDNQKLLYKNFLQTGVVDDVLTGHGNLLAATVTLRKICNHPDILHLPDEITDYGNWNRSGKMTLLQQLLPLWKEEKHRCLIFTQTRKILDILESFCMDMNFSYLRMDGNTSVRKRPELIEQYQSDDSIFLFLMTSKTGGIGVNLTKADRIILYDPDWNPTTDIQARERAWRIGQENSVTIYRLITSGTIEEKIYQRQIYKQFLSNKILKDPKQKRLFHSRLLQDLFRLEEPDDGVTETCDLFHESRVAIDDQEFSSPTTAPIGDNMWERIEPIDENTGIEELLEQVESSAKNQEKKSNALADLLSASGVKHILSHDSVVDSKSESLLENQEANIIAAKAARALQQSAKQCISNAVHVPTWTGSYGSAGAPTKRFGNVPNSNSFINNSPTSSHNIQNYSSPKEKKKAPTTWTSSSTYVAGMTSGTSSSSILSNLGQLGQETSDAPKFGNLPIIESAQESTSPSSQEIISRLKQRSSVEKGGKGVLTSHDRKLDEIATRLHDLFHEAGSVLSSEVIVRSFQDVTKSTHKAFFRKLLRRIATLDKSSQKWTLKDNYRKE